MLCTKFQRTLREQRASSVRRLLKPLSSDNQFDEAINLFRQHRNNVEEEARMCHMVDAAEQRDAQLLLWAAERRQKLLSRLSHIDCKHRHRILREARHEGTGVWLTARDEYRSWATPDVTSVLCCFGIRKSQSTNSWVMLIKFSGVWKIGHCIKRHRFVAYFSACLLLLLRLRGQTDT